MPHRVAGLFHCTNPPSSPVVCCWSCCLASGSLDGYLGGARASLKLHAACRPRPTPDARRMGRLRPLVSRQQAANHAPASFPRPAAPPARRRCRCRTITLSPRPMRTRRWRLVLVRQRTVALGKLPRVVNTFPRGAWPESGDGALASHLLLVCGPGSASPHSLPRRQMLTRVPSLPDCDIDPSPG
jgi:hypothetical protein